MSLDWLRKSTAPAPGLGKGTDGRQVATVNTDRQRAAKAAGDLSDAASLDGKLVVQRRHVDWVEHQIRWRWLMDSFEAGQRYRDATYGPDRRGMPTRNLFRHKREYPDPQRFPNEYQGFAGFLGSVNAQTGDVGYGPYPGMIGADPAATAQDDDYEYRRSRTPIPEFVAEAIELHLAKIYDQEVHREGPADLKAWWKDCDGRGMAADDWMRETVAPLLLVLGCLDIVIDHPKAPPGEKIETRADELRLGLDRCVASYILPQNMVWWRLDAAGRYRECLVREYTDPSDRLDYDKNGNAIDPEDPGNVGEAWRKNYVRYRLWRPDCSIVFSYDGDEILENIPHQFGCVPIIRLVDLRKHRSPHIGKSRYEAVAEYQREYYNRDSELILSDTLQAHPLLCMPEDYLKADNTMPIGPGYMLPMKKNGAEGTSYTSPGFISPPKDPADSLRKNKQDIMDMKDRRACLSAPAGATHKSAGGGGGSGMISQSGISKQLDQHTGHKLLCDIAKTLAKTERQLAEYAAMVLRDKPLDRAERDQIKVTYPSKFEIFAASEMTASLLTLQQAIAGAGHAPQTEGEILKTIVHQTLLGLTDETYATLDAEIELLVATQATLKEQLRSLSIAGQTSKVEAMQGEGSAEQAAGTDPTGESAGTSVSNMTPVVN